MNVRSAMAQLKLIEEALAITDPVDLAIKHVYPYMPNMNTAKPDIPCITNSWTLTGFERKGGFGRVQHYAVHVQLYAGEVAPGAHVAADIATAFWVDFLDRLDRNPGLSGSCNEAIPRGGDPTLALLAERWVGLDFYIDLSLKEGKSFGGG